MTPVTRLQQESIMLMEAESGRGKYWETLFNKNDLDKDGRLTQADLERMIDSEDLNEEDKKKVTMFVTGMDAAGSLSLQEFTAMLQCPLLRAKLEYYVNKYVDFVVPLGRSPYTLHPTADEPGHEGNIFTDSMHAMRRPQTIPMKRYSCWPPFLLMFGVSVIQIAFFIYDVAHGGVKANGPIAQVVVFYPEKREEVWRFLTYILMHTSGFHLLPNVVVELAFGVPLGAKQNWWRMVVVYLVGVTACSLANSVFDPLGPVAGASGGGFALITGHVATIILNWSETDHALLRILCFLLLGAIIVGSSIYSHFVKLKKNTAHSGHIGAAVAGLLVGFLVFRNYKIRDWEKWLWWTALVLYCSLMVTGILINIFWTELYIAPPAVEFNSTILN